MIKNILFIACLLFVLYLSNAKKSPGPLFMWSNKETFTKKKINVLNVDARAVESVLENILSISNKEGDLSPYLNKEIPFPEVVTIFLKPHLSSSKFSISADVYSKDGKGGAYSNLKHAIRSAESSLSVHYSHLQESFATDILAKLSRKLRQTYPNAKEILSSVDQKDKEHFPSADKWVPLSTIEEFLVSGEGTEYLLNGTPDLLIVYFSPKEREEVISSEDKIVGIVSDIVSVSTNNNYVGIFSHDFPEEHVFPTISGGLQQNTIFQSRLTAGDTPANDTIAGTWVPPQMWEAIFIVFILLAALFAGVSVTMSLQIPPKLLDEAMAKKKNK